MSKTTRVRDEKKYITTKENTEDDSPHLAKPAVIHGEYEIQQADFVKLKVNYSLTVQ